MALKIDPSDVAERLKSIINRDFRGNMAEFGRACEKLNPRIDRGNVSAIVDRHAMPKLDTIAVMATAADVSIDWLAGLEKDAPKIAPELTQEPIGDPRVRETGERYSVEAKGQPQPTVYPGFQIGDQLTIDFVVRGKGGRQVIHAGQKGETNDH